MVIPYANLNFYSFWKYDIHRMIQDKDASEPTAWGWTNSLWLQRSEGVHPVLGPTLARWRQAQRHDGGLVLVSTGHTLMQQLAAYGHYR